MRIPMNRIND